MAADNGSRERVGSRMEENVANTVIIHTNLNRSSFTDYLGSGFKIRVSETMPPDSAILPRCGVAVLIVKMPQLSFIPAAGSDETKPKKRRVDHQDGEADQETLDQLIERVLTFQRSHRVSVLVLVGAVFGKEEVGGVIGKLQMSLLPRPPLILPAHGDAQAAAHLQVLGKSTVPERRRVVEDRIDAMLQDTIGQDHNLALGRVIGLNHHQVSVLLEAFGTLSNVAKATAEEIHTRTSISAKTAASIVAFLNRDTVTV